MRFVVILVRSGDGRPAAPQDPSCPQPWLWAPIFVSAIALWRRGVQPGVSGSSGSHQSAPRMYRIMLAFSEGWLLRRPPKVDRGPALAS